MEIGLSARETATAIWILVLAATLAIAIVRSKDIRSAAQGVAKAFFEWKIQLIVVLYLLYVSAVVSGAYWLGIWHTGLVKETLVITLTLGFPLVFNATATKSGGALTRRLLLEVAGLSALLAFYLNLTSLALWAELVVQPLVVLIFMLAAVAALKPETRKIVGSLQFVAGVIGLFLLANTTIQLARGWRDVDSTATLESLALGVALPVSLLPLVYLLAFFARLEVILTLLPLNNDKVRPPRRVRFALSLGLRLSVRYSVEFKGMWLSRVARAERFREARRVMREFRAAIRTDAIAEHIRVARMKERAGLLGTDEAGLTLDRREFAATKDTLDHLFFMEMGWYRNTLNHFKSDMLEILGDVTSRGLSAENEIGLVVSGDKQSWRAHRRTPSGLVFGVGGAAKPGDDTSLLDEWRYVGNTPPDGFPHEGAQGWLNRSRGEVHPEWATRDKE